VSAQNSKSKTFDVFLCHNSEDKPAVRQIAQKLSEENIEPWLDEEQISPATSWQPALEQQIKSIKAAAVFVGESGVGPWQTREILALLNQFDKRGCPAIPVIVAFDHPSPVALPWSLLGLNCVDFRVTRSHPLKRLIWAITGEKLAELSDAPPLEKPATMPETTKCPLLPSTDDRAAVQTSHFGDPGASKARLYPPLAKPPDQEQAKQLEILRGSVVEYWVDGFLKHCFTAKC
jgi:hypothetical protein